jgi:hypothetical protein
MQPYFESANVNDIISVCQKTVMLMKLALPAKAWGDPDLEFELYYRNDDTNPTLFRVEAYGAPVMGNANVTWPGNMAASANPFGIEAVQGQDVLTAEEKALWLVGSIDYTGWFETRGIGL